MSAITAILGALRPPPSTPIPDWRRVQRRHPKSSQIGVELSDEVSIGVGLEVLDLPITAITCDVGDPGDLGLPSPYPSTRIPKDLPWVIPDPSQPGPVHARFSRGWAEIGVGLSGFGLANC